MKIAMIGASPKPTGSASALLLKDIRPYIQTDNAIVDLGLHKPGITREQTETIVSCDALVFSFPLYIDGIPSHLLRCLEALKQSFAGTGKKITVYAMVNCGFFEAEQAAPALEMMAHWSREARLVWGRGLGYGAGGMLPALVNVPAGRGPKKNLGRVLEVLSADILSASGGEDLFTRSNFPRFAYRLAAHMGWNAQARKNGLKKADLSRRM